MANAWRQFLVDHDETRLVLAARAILPEPLRERGEIETIERLRAHHLRLEQLVDDACGGDPGGWGVQLGYRGDAVLVVCDKDRVEDLVLVAWKMVDQLDRDRRDLHSCIGISREQVIDVSQYREGVSSEWPSSTDFQGLGVERALGLVHDFGDPGQILLSGDLVRVDLPTKISGDGYDGQERDLRLEPKKEDAHLLRASLESTKVAQLAWDSVEPGTLTNRHLLGRELKVLQPAVAGVISLFEQEGPLMFELYSGEEGASNLQELDDFVSRLAPGRLKSLRKKWDEAPEAQEQEDLAHLMGKLGEDFETVVKAFRGVQSAVRDDDSGERNRARGRLEIAWQDCRETPKEIMDQVEDLTDELYS